MYKAMLLLIWLFISITPASAVEVGSQYNALMELKNDSDINTIEKWNDGNGWYRFWHLIEVGKAIKSVYSKSDNFKSKVSSLNSSLEELTSSGNLTATNLTSIKAFVDKQDALDIELDDYLGANGSQNSPITAINDTNTIASELKSDNGTIDVDVKSNIVMPKNGDIVQLISDVNKNNDIGRHNLVYWLVADITTDDQGTTVKLYNGKDYVYMDSQDFKARFTGVVLNVTDKINNGMINQSNGNSSVNSTNNETIGTNQTTTTQNDNLLAASTHLRHIVVGIQKIQRNQLNALKNLVPPYDKSHANYLNELALIFAIISAGLWILGVLCGVVALVISILSLGALAFIGIIFAGIGLLLEVLSAGFAMASAVCFYKASKMSDQRDVINLLDNMLDDLDARTVP
jgi:hypothetical protein